jgi:hypothetical protein
MLRTNLKKLNEIEVNEQIQADVSNRFAAFKSLEDYMDISRAWETI